MKEELRNAVAEIESKMGNLEGFILITIDEEKQVSNFVGPCIKMLVQVATEDEEVMEILEKSIRAAKIQKKMKELIDIAKEYEVLDLDEVSKELREDENK